MSIDDQTRAFHRQSGQRGGRPNSVERVSARTSICAEVSLRRVGHHNFKVQIFDLSPRGCKVEYIDRPELDEIVFVKFDALEPLRAYVCWISEREVGLEFDRPIYPAVFDLLVQRALASATVRDGSARKRSTN